MPPMCPSHRSEKTPPSNILLRRPGAAPSAPSRPQGGQCRLGGAVETSTQDGSPSPGLSRLAREPTRLIGLSVLISWGEVRAGPGRVVTAEELQSRSIRAGLCKASSVGGFVGLGRVFSLSESLARTCGPTWLCSRSHFSSKVTERESSRLPSLLL